MPTWGQALDSNDFPHNYFTNFGAFVCNTVAFIFPGYITEPSIKFFAEFVLKSSTPPEDIQWLTDEYLPEIVRATRSNRIPFMTRFDLWKKFMGVLIKNIFAFAFQE